MSQRINTAQIAIGMAAGFAAGGQAFRDSLARDRARARVATSLASHRQDVYRQATVAIAQRDLFVLLDL